MLAVKNTLTLDLNYKWISTISENVYAIQIVETFKFCIQVYLVFVASQMKQAAKENYRDTINKF